MDINGDGKLSKQEIQQGYKDIYGAILSEEEVNALFLRVDIDKSNEIDYSEFVIATMNEKEVLSSNKLHTAFKMFDKDGGGTISPDEIKQILSFGKHLDEKVI
jgi:Ca2+-binding EF-hand superfamily protein